MSIEKGNNVKLHYTGKFENGDVFDTSKEREPLEIVVGSNQIITKLEESIIGMSSGDEKTIELDPKDAYGERNEELIKEMPLNSLPEGIKVGTPLKGTTPEGQPLQSVVKEMKEETAVLDFNHVLSGKKLIFDLDIIEVNESTEDTPTDESTDITDEDTSSDESK
jgi:FKBP-type peptidyl-prolyl cis-trans isomerase 2